MRNLGYIALGFAALVAAIWIVGGSSTPPPREAEATGVYRVVGVLVGPCDAATPKDALDAVGFVAVREDGAFTRGHSCSDEAACRRWLEAEAAGPIEEPGAWTDLPDTRWFEMPWRARRTPPSGARAAFVTTSSSPSPDGVQCTASEVTVEFHARGDHVGVDWSLARSEPLASDDCMDARRTCRRRLRIELARVETPDR